jgi:hypothetical protein
VLKFAGADWYLTSWAASSGAQILGIVMYILLIAYFVTASKKIK